jgi:hypothetical protein
MRLSDAIRLAEGSSRRVPAPILVANAGGLEPGAVSLGLRRLDGHITDDLALEDRDEIRVFPDGISR